MKKIMLFIFIIIILLNNLSFANSENDLLDFFDRLNGVWNPDDFNYETVETEFSWGKGRETPNVSIIFENDIVSVPSNVIEIISINEKTKNKIYLIKFFGEDSEYETEIHFLEGDKIKFVDSNDTKGAFLFFTSKTYKKIASPKIIDKKYLKSTIKNLSFREMPSTNSNRIRMLNNVEKLRFLKKGKQETIDGKKGTWVKVITEKGEVGWCFDAYLKEWTEDVKKN